MAATISAGWMFAAGIVARSGSEVRSMDFKTDCGHVGAASSKEPQKNSQGAGSLSTRPLPPAPGPPLVQVGRGSEFGFGEIQPDSAQEAAVGNKGRESTQAA
ncbi:hypothetical protein THAOC_10541 [Thalassiosira oceanica]|uniref:Uncharacterized protein n=1 Tax=Thalassiosira oceanica TaxID=159749 RepID=K0SSC3_THAOC|nr:hypothetical protein THAOC_10541 [Thalassiosira oceanica]|eukprot:EJK68295.1 hypothetical protein THAOC_10541 [Thalassiosira oceanica]